MGHRLRQVGESVNYVGPKGDVNVLCIDQDRELPLTTQLTPATSFEQLKRGEVRWLVSLNPNP